MSYKVRVTGVKELNRAWRAIDAGLPKELRGAFLAISEKVAADARGRVPVITGEAAGSLRATATQRGAGISFPAGGTSRGKAQYYPWLDFGGTTGIHHSIHRDVIKGGRYVYPAIEDARERIIEGVGDAIDKVAQKAGF